MGAPALIAVDWGTSSARAWLLDAAGEAIEERRAPLGVMHVPSGGYPQAFASLLGPWIGHGGGLGALACGMVGSRQGWREAPYLECPFAPGELAGALIEIDTGSPVRLWVVPGARCEGPWGPDVMRGEETQVLGAARSGPDGRAAARGLVVLPGTHSKWVWLEQGRVMGFRTFMTGELFGVLRSHSILGRLMVEAADRGSSEGFERGAVAGLDARGDLAAKLFSARTLPLLGRMDADAVADYLSGLLVGAEVREALAWAREGASPPPRPVLVGEADLCARYASAFRLAGLEARIEAPGAASRGLWALAGMAGLVGRKGA
jgi:2-dehydro-3-deoxygalactonokinase